MSRRNNCPGCVKAIESEAGKKGQQAAELKPGIEGGGRQFGRLCGVAAGQGARGDDPLDEARNALGSCWDETKAVRPA